MHRGYNNFSYVIDSSFQPFSMQEMLVPFTAYKDTYEKMEEDYTELSKNASDFDYLSKTLPEGSKARQIYEGYANDLKAQADDLAKNGLGMGNRRSLLNMKRRYSGEIGRLRKADEALKQEQALRRQMSAKDPSMLYADDNLNIDSYLDGQTPNLYGISGTDLYTKAAAASQAMSKRQFSVNGESKTLGGYYYDYIQRMGYTPEQLRQFGDQISADFAAQVSVLPELQQAANQILEANGVTENFKDNPNNLRKAQLQVIRGLIDGAVYSEQHNPTRDLGKLTQSEQTSFNLQREGMNRQAAAQGLTWNGKEYVYDVNKDPSVQKQIAVLEKRKELGIGNGNNTTSTSSTGNSAKFPKANPQDLQKILINNGTTSNGTILSGEGEDTEIKKVDMTASARYAPFYGDAWNNDVKNGFDVLDWETSAFDEKEDDAKPYKFSQLKSDEAKQQIRDHVQEIIPDVLEGLTSNQVDEVIGYMDFVRDYDRFSDNHFRLSVPGTNSEGKIVDKNKFNAFLSKVNKLRIRTMKEGMAVTQQAPAGILGTQAATSDSTSVSQLIPVK